MCTHSYIHTQRIQTHTAFAKINSKQITDPNVKYLSIKLSEVNNGENLDDFRFEDYILDTIPKAQFRKKNNDKLDSVKFKTSALHKTVSRE